MAVNGLEKSAEAARPEIERFAADRMANVDAAVAAVKAKFDDGNFGGAMADAPAATNMVTAAAEAAAARKAQLSTEWATFAGMPAVIGQIKAKMGELEAMRRLPRGMDRAKLKSGQSSIESLTTLWDEATKAHDDGNLVIAVSKARDAKPIADSLWSGLGLAPPAM